MSHPAIFLLFVVGAFGAGWTVQGWRGDAVLAKAEKTWAEAEKDRAEAKATLLTEANARGDDLALQLEAYRNTLTTFAEEKNREIARLSTGRRCLDAGLVRVLNSAPDHQPFDGRPVSETGAKSVRPDGGPAADPDDGRFATDGDIAGWANLCRTRYDTCRGKLDALNLFYQREN